MKTSRLTDRIFVTFVILVGSWSLLRYYTYCFSDCLSALTARSLIITTTTTTYTVGAIGDIAGAAAGAIGAAGGGGQGPGAAALIGGGLTADGNGPPPAATSRSLSSRRDSRSPAVVRAELREEKRALEQAKKASKKAKDEEVSAVVNGAYIPTSVDGKGKTTPLETVAASTTDEVVLLEAAAAGGPPRRRRTSKKTVVKKVTMRDRLTPIVLRDLLWLLASLFCTALMVWSYYVAATTDPGVVPRCFSVHAQRASRMALSTGGALSKCGLCHVFKPPRCHHCSKCGRCVLKYDHHCFWIGQCVGYFNYKVFLCFCFWTCVFTNVASVSLSRSVYLFFLQLAARATARQETIHSLTQTTTTYIRDSPVMGSTEVSDAPITWDILLLFFVFLIAGSLSWHMLKKHYYLARENTTTVEFIALDGAPSPYSLSRAHNWEEVFGDRGPAARRGWVARWAHRLVPTLAYGSQQQSDIDSEAYFNLIREEKRRQKLIREYRNLGGFGGYGATLPTAAGGGGAVVGVASALKKRRSRKGNATAAADDGTGGDAVPSSVGTHRRRRRVKIREDGEGGGDTAVVMSTSGAAADNDMATGAGGVVTISAEALRMLSNNANDASNKGDEAACTGSGSSSVETMSQPSESDTEDEEKQQAKEAKRRANEARLQRRITRRDRRFRSPQSSSALFGRGNAASHSGLSFGSSAGCDGEGGATPYNPPHTPPDRCEASPLLFSPPSATNTAAGGVARRRRPFRLGPGGGESDGSDAFSSTDEDGCARGIGTDGDDDDASVAPWYQKHGVRAYYRSAAEDRSGDENYEDNEDGEIEEGEEANQRPRSPSSRPKQRRNGGGGGASDSSSAAKLPPNLAGTAYNESDDGGGASSHDGEGEGRPPAGSKAYPSSHHGVNSSFDHEMLCVEHELDNPEGALLLGGGLGGGPTIAVVGGGAGGCGGDATVHVVELCPPGTHFAKHAAPSDDGDGSDGSEDGGTRGGASASDAGGTTVTVRSRRGRRDKKRSSNTCAVPIIGDSEMAAVPTRTAGEASGSSKGRKGRGKKGVKHTAET